MSFSSVTSTVSHFETVIRVLGGLLSAFDLSGEKEFLDKASDLGGRMTNVFRSGTGLPFHGINIASNVGRRRRSKQFFCFWFVCFCLQFLIL